MNGNDEFGRAMETARMRKDQMFVINARVKETSPGMRRLAKEVSRRMQAAT